MLMMGISAVFLPRDAFGQLVDNRLQFGDDAHLEFVTWNVENFPKDPNNTPDYVAEVIDELDVDVLALQEVKDTARLRRLVRGLAGFQMYVSPNADDFLPLAYVYKSSTVRINRVYQLFASSSFSREFPRRPLVMEATLAGQRYIVINNHFKCCGDGRLASSNWDEERRRKDAIDLLKNYLDGQLPNARVVLLGDLNDELDDAPANNVFQAFLDDTDDYRFTDLAIAQGSSADWSYPPFPSHLDHILVSNELFTALARSGSETRTIRVDDFLSGGFNQYEFFITDHRPVGLKLDVGISVGVEATARPAATPFRLRPNPVRAHAHFSFPALEAPGELRLYNSLGRTIRRVRLATGIQTATLDLGPLAPGVYQARLLSGGQGQAERTFLKQ
jgi:endonuclease/exonuclease/phosphatase family metal-dependent hydrolase